MKEQILKNSGIARKLLAYFLILSLLPLLIGGMLSYGVSRNRCEEKSRQHLSDLARDCGKKISYYMDSRYQDIRMLSLADVFKGKDRRAMQSYIEEVHAAAPFYQAIAFLNPEGTMIASVPKGLVGESRSKAGWFQKAIQGARGEVTALDPFRSRMAGGDVVAGLNMPVTDKEGRKIFGVLALRIGMAYIIERVKVLDQRSVGHNHACLLNRKGEIIAGADSGEFLKPHPLHGCPVIQDMLAGRAGISKYTDERGEDVIGAAYALQGDGNFDGWGWGLIVAQSLSDAFRGAYIIRNTLIALMLVIAAIVSLFAFVISRKFSKPVTDLSAAVLRISQGDIQPIETDYDEKDEIGGLIGAFNKMAHDLHATTVSRDSLTKEIAERKKAEERIKRLSMQIINIQERERASISREIHDNVGQLLSATKMALSRAHKKIPEELSPLKEQLWEILGLVNKTITEVRALSHALHPPLIEDLGISTALEELCDDFKSYSDITIVCAIERIEKQLPSITKITLYRFFQEGLNNIIKHSKATRASLTLTSSDSGITAVIEDNGVGFSVDDVITPMQTKSLGLISMKERVALIGGELHIESSLGKGTKLSAYLERE